MTCQRISQRMVNALKPNGHEFTIGDDTISGFGVRVRVTGAASYVVVYRAGSGRGAAVRRYTIAAVGKIAPEDARARAKIILGSVAHGHDPRGRKRPNAGYLLWPNGRPLLGRTRRYSPAQVVAVEYDVVSGVPAQISTSYVERSNLSIRTGIKRFARLSNGFSKKLDPHCAAVSLYVAHYNLCRVHETLRATPAQALGIADRVWTIGDLLDAALATQPTTPVTTAPDRRKRFRVVEGGKD